MGTSRRLPLSIATARFFIAGSYKREFDATLVWLSTEPLSLGKRYAINHTTQGVKAKVAAIRDVASIGANDIARVRIVVQRPLAVDRYRDNRATGAFILIDETTHHTVTAGMVE